VKAHSYPVGTIGAKKRLRRPELLLVVRFFETERCEELFPKLRTASRGREHLVEFAHSA
jgi:hypothetical protein